MAYAASAAVIATPIGPVRIESDGVLLTAIRIGVDDAERESDTGAVRSAVAQLRAYFAGALHAFDLPLKPAKTERGEEIRAAMRDVRFGQVATYGALSDALSSSARAIGQACRTNAFPIIVPCHRILSAGNRLGHYSAGEGIETKRRLLIHENAQGWHA